METTPELETQEPQKTISGRNIIKDPKATRDKVPVSFLSNGLWDRQKYNIQRRQKVW